MQRSISYGDARIDFTIRLLPGPDAAASKRVRISLLTDGRVEAHAPEGTDAETVVRAVRQRARWIWQQLDAWRARRVHVLPREYVSGESHFYLGRRHVLKVRVAADAAPGVKLLRGRLDVTAPDARAGTVRALLQHWYRQRAADVFARRLALIAGQTGWLTTLPEMRLLTMRTQWGSCSPGGLLILNPALVKAPSACIDYVLGHELCHLREHNHSGRFYALLGCLMPDWRERKQELDGLAELILEGEEKH